VRYGLVQRVERGRYGGVEAARTLQPSCWTGCAREVDRFGIKRGPVFVAPSPKTGPAVSLDFPSDTGLLDRKNRKDRFWGIREPSKFCARAVLGVDPNE
jgi:hypothetical protein